MIGVYLFVWFFKRILNYKMWNWIRKKKGEREWRVVMVLSRVAEKKEEEGRGLRHHWRTDPKPLRLSYLLRPNGAHHPLPLSSTLTMTYSLYLMIILTLTLGASLTALSRNAGKRQTRSKDETPTAGAGTPSAILSFASS